MSKTICVLMLVMLVALAAGCSQNPSANDNASAIAAASPTTTAGPDNSEITTSVDSSGTKTETRTFKNNPRISKVVVTTRDGRRTVRAYSAKGEEREVTTNENVLEATGDKVASAAGFVADKAEDVPGEAKTAAKEVGDKAEDVKDKTVSTTKKVGEKTVEGAKKVGSETKKAVKKVIP